MKIPVIIDGRMVQVDHDTPIIGAAKKAGVVIPTLCHHEALNPYGGCRLCLVEVVVRKQKRLVTSCNHTVEHGMEIFTDTAPVKRIRAMLVEILLARCPDVPAIKTLAKRMGVETSRFKKKEEKECLLCGLCVRFCEEIVGASAIGLSNRGTEREVSTPFGAPTDACILCGSCTYICPAECIEMEPDAINPDMRAMTIGRLSPEPCNADYTCNTCEKDKKFFDEIKTVLARFRKNSGKESSPVN
jgi:NADH dehydrogenase/NADH:ubiquinone oxidoreductase subunit G